MLTLFDLAVFIPVALVLGVGLLFLVHPSVEQSEGADCKSEIQQFTGIEYFFGTKLFKVIECFTLMAGSQVFFYLAQQTETLQPRITFSLLAISTFSYLILRMTRPTANFRIDFEELHKSYWIGLCGALPVSMYLIPMYSL